MREFFAFAMLVVLLDPVTTAHEVGPQATLLAEYRCKVTEPNGQGTLGGGTDPFLFGNQAMAVLLWPDGVVVFKPGGPGAMLADGSLSMKFPWERHIRGQLTVDGRRLDAPARPLRADVPCCYGETGFQATALIFPTPGCWEITGHLADASLTFVTRVVKVGESLRQ